MKCCEHCGTCLPARAYLNDPSFDAQLSEPAILNTGHKNGTCVAIKSWQYATDEIIRQRYVLRVLTSGDVSTAGDVRLSLESILSYEEYFWRTRKVLHCLDLFDQSFSLSPRHRIEVSQLRRSEEHTSEL